MNTVLGVLCDKDGLASGCASGQKFLGVPSGLVADEQPATIRVDHDHDHQWCGRVLHLERADGNLWCVAEVDAEPCVRVRVADTIRLVPHPLYFSPTWRIPDDGSPVTLLSVALTRSPASIAPRPLTWFAGEIAHRSSWHFDQHGTLIHGLVTRAGESNITRFGRGHTLVHDQQPRTAWHDYDGRSVTPAGTRTRPGGHDRASADGWWHSSGGRVLSVR